MIPASPDGPPPDTAPATTPPAPPAFDAAACGAFLESLRGRDAPGCIQLQMFGCYKDRRNRIVPADRKSIVYAGWYDNHSAVICDAEKAAGVSVYVALNPVKPEFLSVIRNDLAPCQAAAQVGDILSIDNLFIDIDPNRPIQAKISATAAERALALACRDQILADHPAIARAAVWGCSGNGGYILARLPSYPNDEDHRKLVAEALDILAAMYGRQAKRHGENPPVWVDTGTANPNRIMCLPGTVKCKGVATPERPWRPVTLDSGPAGREPGATLDLRAWVEENRHRGGGKATKANVNGNVNGHGHGPGGNGDPAGGGGRPDAVERARRYVASFPGAVSGAGGQDRTFEIACRLFEDFDVTPDQAWSLLSDYNARCEPAWDEKDLRHKMQDADKKVTVRGKKLNEDRPGYSPPAVKPAINGAVNGVHTPRKIERYQHPQNTEFVPFHLEANPHRLAYLYTGLKCSKMGEYTLRFWQEEWLRWDRGAYRPVTAREIRADLTDFASQEFENLYERRCIAAARKAAGDDGEKAREPTKTSVTTKLIGDIMQAISGIVLVPSSEYPCQPAWLSDDRPDWQPSEVLPVRNGLIHLPSLIAGLPHAAPPSPAFFAPYALDYDFNPDAPAPEDWTDFLEELWPGDAESIEALQEWFGYHLTTDTRQQKILLMIGPTRSGKGTIARVLKAMIGPENVGGISLSDLSQTFGLQPLIGKMANIFSDVRITSKTDLGAMSERLLNVSGEDHVSINRKNTTAWTGTLPVKFTMISNELPRIHDSSGALPGRFLIVRMTKSFKGAEDTMLTDRLMKNLPGILNWAIVGYRRLIARNKFIQPQTATDCIEQMEDLASPVGAFFKDECMESVGAETSCAEVYERWKTWCRARGREHVGQSEVLGRDLRSVLPNLQTAQLRREGIKGRFYLGLELKPAYELPETVIGEEVADDTMDSDLPNFDAVWPPY